MRREKSGDARYVFYLFFREPKEGVWMADDGDFVETEMKLITAAIYTNYRTYIVDDEGIEQEDAYTAHPKSNKLVLRFERVEK